VSGPGGQWGGSTPPRGLATGCGVVYHPIGGVDNFWAFVIQITEANEANFGVFCQNFATLRSYRLD